MSYNENTVNPRIRRRLRAIMREEMGAFGMNMDGPGPGAQAAARDRYEGPFGGFGRPMSWRAKLKRAQRRGRLSAAQAAQARGALAQVQTPMSVGSTTLAAPGTGTITKQVSRHIPPGSTLWVSGLAGGDTVDSVQVDGINIFTDGAVDAALVDPTNFHATGILIPSAVSQQVVVTATLGVAGTFLATLLAPSVEVEGILETAADCECDE